MASDLDLSYPGVLKHFRAHLVQGRTESRAFLSWFLEHFYRLDDTDALDAVCDGPDDKGVDGIYVDDNLETIDVLQCRLFQNTAKTLGDTALKEFVGTLAQFSNSNAVDDLVKTTTNQELAKLIGAVGVGAKIEKGYTVRGVFVTNVKRNQNATEYLSREQQLVLFDARELHAGYLPARPRSTATTPITCDLVGYDAVTYQVSDVKVVIAPLRAVDLVRLDGLASGALFAWNVRASLGRTKVNKEIAASIDDPSEHLNFLLYHNGLTILCQSLDTAADSLTLGGYSVVNGCQSLTSLYARRHRITDSLRVLCRLIELSPGCELAEKITHHSNNQNPINARDLQSNSAVQRRLQNEFARDYATQIFYRISRGERSDLPETIDNEDAGRALLAFDLRQPWTCHQSYKVFDELHAEIFARPEVSAHRILAAWDISQEAAEGLRGIESKPMATYRLTQYFLMYLVRRALESDLVGAEFCRDPGEFLRQDNGRMRVKCCVRQLVRDLVIDINAEVRERQQASDPLDYKRELKSPNAVARLERNTIPSYQKAVSRGRVPSFATEWAESASCAT